MQDSMKKLFAEYESAFNALEVESRYRSSQSISFQRVRRAVSHTEEMSSLRWLAKQQNFTEAWGRHRQKFFLWTKPQSAMSIPWSGFTGV